MPTYADNACTDVAVEENVALAKDTFRIRFACQRSRGGCAGAVRHAAAGRLQRPALGPAAGAVGRGAGRAGKPHFVDVVYLVIGKMTRLLARVPTRLALDVWGPLGQRFPTHGDRAPADGRGGIGQTPFLALAREYLGLMAYGDPARAAPRRRKSRFAMRPPERVWPESRISAGPRGSRLSTDDGSLGHHGLVTELVRPAVQHRPGPAGSSAAGRSR